MNEVPIAFTPRWMIVGPTEDGTYVKRIVLGARSASGECTAVEDASQEDYLKGLPFHPEIWDIHLEIPQ